MGIDFTRVGQVLLSAVLAFDAHGYWLVGGKACWFSAACVLGGYYLWKLPR